MRTTYEPFQIGLDGVMLRELKPEDIRGAEEFDQVFPSTRVILSIVFDRYWVATVKLDIMVYLGEVAGRTRNSSFLLNSVQSEDVTPGVSLVPLFVVLALSKTCHRFPVVSL